MKPAAERLERLLGGDKFAALLRRLCRPFERLPANGRLERFRVSDLTPEEAIALALLLGRGPRTAGSLLVDVVRVDAAFREAGIASSLRQALEMLDGPITNPAEERLGQQLLWQDVIAGCRHPDLAALLGTAHGAGLLKRLARQEAGAAAALCRQAEAVLGRLPANGMPRAQLAAETLGDAHALDNGRGAATLVLATRRMVTRASGNDDVERQRDLWAAAGILVNELARPALLLNVPMRDSRGPSLGEPGYLSLRSLLRTPPAWDLAGRDVFVCENPNLLGIAADQLRENCAPLVCTDGMPAAAQRRLLTQLVRAGASLRYHGDFDWPGIAIGNHVMREHGALPWRFSAADYAEALAAAGTSQQSLVGRPVEACWDASLSPLLQEHGVSIAEEAVAASLMRDLG